MLTTAVFVTLSGLFIGCAWRSRLEQHQRQIDPTLVRMAETMVEQARAVHEHQMLVGERMIATRTVAFSIKGLGEFEAEISKVRVSKQGPVHPPCAPHRKRG